MTPVGLAVTTRADQGLPPTIEDDGVLEAAAALLFDPDLLRKVGDDGRAA
jgi:hypothetical protein